VTSSDVDRLRINAQIIDIIEALENRSAADLVKLLVI